MQRARGRGNRLVHRRVVGRGDRDLGAYEIAGREALGLVAQRAHERQFSQARAQLWGDQRHARARAQKRLGFLRRDLAAADHDGGLAAQVEKGGEIGSVRCWNAHFGQVVTLKARGDGRFDPD
jgi:hypothetical protein